MKWVATISAVFALSAPTAAFAVTLTDLLKNDFVAFSSLHRNEGGYIVFLQKKSAIYACEVFDSQSSCILLDALNQLAD